MKVHYTKYNSERAKPFQLNTIIYEENGQKFVKKEALTPEALSHLKEMKKSYETLQNSITNPKIKLANIVEESENSLTFEYIQGESFEKRYHQALKESKQEALNLLQSYIDLLKHSFEVVEFNAQTMVKEEHHTLFGELSYGSFNEELAFDNLSNLDLILSNLIFKEEEIYLIDYEWVYPITIPLSYIFYRTLSILPELNEEDLKSFGINITLSQKMEKHFLNAYVMRDGFYLLQDTYKQEHVPLIHQVHAKEAHIQELSVIQRELYHELMKTTEVVKHRDQVINDLMNMSIVQLSKKLIKRILKKLIPKILWRKLRELKQKHYEYTHREALKKQHEGNYQCKETLLTETIEEEIQHFSHKPLISIVMPVYNVDPKWLELAIASIKKQWYTNWELCIADDKSTNEATLSLLKSIDDTQIKVTFLEQNLNISGATNAALTLASGEYIALMDNDDEITPDALYEMVKAINTYQADFIYSDEDFITPEGQCTNPHFKPDFSPDLLLSHNYITHFSCFKKSLLEKAGNFNSTYDGSQDYDLFLRLTENATHIHHIPKVLYHWRMLETSTSANSKAKPESIARGKQLLEKTLQRRAIDADVLTTKMDHYYRVKYTIQNNPLVSIVIPFKDKPELLEVCVKSILEKSTYQNYEIIGISNNSEEAETFQLMERLASIDARVSFYEYNVPFNYSEINNYGVNTHTKGEHILLLNNDIEIINDDWLEAMLEHSQRPEVGCVGAKLYFSNDTVQHAGIIIGLGGYAGHSHKMFLRNSPGYFNRLNSVQNISAVTGACLMVKKSLYQQINGLNEVDFKVAYNDVDFCLRIQELGYLNIFTPYAEAYHYESISRGYEETPEKIARFQKEKDALHRRHKEILENGDPYYNLNLTRNKEDFSICHK
jgi:GT2 family glycosyltransferase